MISSSVVLDREARSQYMLPVIISDKGIPVRSALYSIRIYVDDVSEFAPQSIVRSLVVEGIEKMRNRTIARIAPVCRDEVFDFTCSMVDDVDQQNLQVHCFKKLLPYQ